MNTQYSFNEIMDLMDKPKTTARISLHMGAKDIMNQPIRTLRSLDYAGVGCMLSRITLQDKDKIKIHVEHIGDRTEIEFRVSDLPEKKGGWHPLNRHERRRRDDNGGTILMIPEIMPHPTWDIIDSSKLTTSMSCLRAYFYEYILGWRVDRPNIHFIFGQAWHKAMDYLFLNGCVESNLEPAFEEFLKVYRTAYAPEDEDESSAKTSTNARAVLAEYIQTYKGDKFTPLHVEIPGQVNITDDWAITLRLDLLVRNEHGRVLVIDHKTTSVSSQTWRDQWALNIQMGTYIHAANSIFGVDEVEGALINGAVLRKPIRLKKDGEPYAGSKGPEFIRVPVTKTRDQMNLWLDIVRYYYSEIKTNHLILEDCTADTATMRAFPCNPTACTKYNQTCPYMSFCVARSNPLALVQQLEGGVPVGFVREYWNPTLNEEEGEVT